MKKKIFKTFAAGLIFTAGLFRLSAQNQIVYSGSGTYTLVERTDLRRYDNNKYIGLVSREVRSFITPVAMNNGYMYEGNFFVHQDTMRNYSAAAAGIHDSILSVFKISKDGQLTMIEDHGYPSFRSFPSYPDKKIVLGDRWQAKAERAVDPLNKGIVTKMPIYVEYTYAADDNLNGEPCYRLTAQWATRYGMGSGTSYIDWGGDRDLQKAAGSHKATILVSKISGNALVVRDNVDETFVYSDGNQITFKGTINLFTEYPPSVNRDRLLPALRRFAMIDAQQEKELAMALEPGKSPFDSADGANTGMNTNMNAGVNTGSRTDSSAGNKGGAAVAAAKSEGKTGTAAAGKPNTAAKADTSEKFGDIKSEPIAMADEPGNKSSKKQKNLTEAYKDDNVLDNLNSKTSAKTNSSSDVKQKAAETNSRQISVEQTAAGIMLTIQNLQFQADSSKLVPGESKRLDDIAAVLKEAGNSQFLIEGHTASTGREAGELQLSLERAHAIADELVKRGIAAGRFICKGSGGKKPVASNSTAEGKAKNRRVEITILE